MCTQIVPQAEPKDKSGLWNITPQGYYRLLGFAKWVIFAHPY